MLQYFNFNTLMSNLDLFKCGLISMHQFSIQYPIELYQLKIPKFYLN